MPTEVTSDSSAFAYDRDAPLDIREAGLIQVRTTNSSTHGMAPARKGFPILVFKDDMKACELIGRTLSGSLVILCLPGEPLLDIDVHAPVAAVW